MHKLKGLIPFIITGLFLGLAFPPMPLPFLAFVAFVPLLFSFENESQNSKYILKTYLTFFIYHGMSNWWISSWQQNTDPYLFISGFAVWLINPFFFLIPIILYRYIRRKTNLKTALISFPFIWTFFEWGHGLGELSYPWLNIGYSQIDFFYWIQQLDIWGIYGAGFVIASVNSLTLYIAKFLSDSSNKDLKAITLPVLAIFVLIILPIVYGYVKVDNYETTNSNSSLKVSIIQPNMDPWDKWSLSPEGQVLKHIDIQDSLAKVSGKSDLALWSETAIPYLSMSFNCYNNFSFLQRWIDTSGTYLITGMARYELFDKETAPALSKKAAWDSTVYFQAYNSSVLISPNMSNPPQIYRKSKLTPFAERIPYAEYIPFATDFLNWGVGISAWGKGDSISTLNFKKDNFQYKIGNIICIESIYPEFCTQFVNEGANILVIITNDAWYNHTPGPYQHYMIARARAIENRRFIARCANSGISGLISLTGESVSELPQYEQAGIKVEVPAITEISIYSKYGDFIGKISFVFVLISIIYAKYSKINITQNKD